MPKYICKCGNIINLSDIPSPNQLLLIEDRDYDKYFGDIDAEKLHHDMSLVVRCVNCKRLYIFENGYSKEPIVYQIEKGKWNKND
ncbi:hypothetical protein [Epilithonimonas sp. UC225_85]|uniref:hypothetical protein n=1 Tax=Epilithonimonas sp. UC225_85 TaxID=3350167 RepID=UPI0036D3D7D7